MLTQAARIVPEHGQVRDLEVVVARPRKFFQVMAQVVTQKARRPALKRRKSRHRLYAIALQPLVEAAAADAVVPTRLGNTPRHLLGMPEDG